VTCRRPRLGASGPSRGTPERERLMSNTDPTLLGCPRLRAVADTGRSPTQASATLHRRLDDGGSRPSPQPSKANTVTFPCSRAFRESTPDDQTGPSTNRLAVRREKHALPTREVAGVAVRKDVLRTTWLSPCANRSIVRTGVPRIVSASKRKLGEPRSGCSMRHPPVHPGSHVEGPRWPQSAACIVSRRLDCAPARSSDRVADVCVDFGAGRA
jgi:hypothetical protein